MQHVFNLYKFYTQQLHGITHVTTVLSEQESHILLTKHGTLQQLLLALNNILRFGIGPVINTYILPEFSI